MRRLDRLKRDPKALVSRTARRRARIRAMLWKRQEGRCFYCFRRLLHPDVVTPVGRRQPSRLATFDHVMAKASGGEGRQSNIVLACRRCNARKGRRLADDFVAELHGRHDCMHIRDAPRAIIESYFPREEGQKPPQAMPSESSLAVLDGGGLGFQAEYDSPGPQAGGCPDFVECRDTRPQS